MPHKELGQEELRTAIAKLYSDSHPYPEIVAKKWPDQFADKAMTLFTAHLTKLVEQGPQDRPEIKARIHTLSVMERNTGYNQAIKDCAAAIEHYCREGRVRRNG